MKRTPLKRRTPLRRRFKRMSMAERAQKERFNRVVREKGSCVMACACDPCDYHGRDADPHHVIPKQTLKREGKPLWDPRNGVPLCRKHHDQITYTGRKLPVAPESALQFAEQHDMVRHLERNAEHGTS